MNISLESVLFQFSFHSPPFIHVAARFNEETTPIDWAEIKTTETVSKATLYYLVEVCTMQAKEPLIEDSRLAR